ncbi:MAG: pyridoxal phosphate-dependent aminotransferase [Methanomassiliicoccales archaeon]|nr:pyridoxal phosphate-dependent aminotransferase [Methanomassiliicoccales archaeon]
MFAKRMEGVPESGTVKIANLVSKLKAEGVDIISFSMGEPDFHTPDNIKEACVRSLARDFTYYTPSAGIPELRKAVAERSRQGNKIPCEASNVLITPTKQAIFMTMLAMVDHGDEVIVPDIAWGTFEACAKLAGGNVRYAKLSPEKAFRMTPKSLAEQITKKTKLVVLNSPSNPCGAVLTKEDVKGVADLAKDHDLFVLADEIYDQLVFEGEHISISSLDGMFERTITVNGFSKTYAMTGWRAGWAIAPPPIFKELNKLQTQSITCVTSFVQEACLEALRGPQGSVTKMKQEFKARRDLVHSLIEAIPGLECPMPNGAFYMMPSYAHDMTSEDMATYLLEEAHVAVTPGSAFGPAGEGRFRLSYAASRTDIKEGMARIEKALAKL